jgi:hypothetical protein
LRVTIIALDGYLEAACRGSNSLAAMGKAIREPNSKRLIWQHFVAQFEGRICWKVSRFPKIWELAAGAIGKDVSGGRWGKASKVINTTLAGNLNKNIKLHK